MIPGHTFCANTAYIGHPSLRKPLHRLIGLLVRWPLHWLALHKQINHASTKASHLDDRAYNAAVESLNLLVTIFALSLSPMISILAYISVSQTGSELPRYWFKEKTTQAHLIEGLTVVPGGDG